MNIIFILGLELSDILASRVLKMISYYLWNSQSTARIIRQLCPFLFTTFKGDFAISWAFLVAQRVKNLPVMQETQVLPQGLEDPLEKGMATHSSILAWRIPWTEKPGGLESMGSQRVGHDWATNIHTCLFLFTKFKWIFLTCAILLFHSQLTRQWLGTAAVLGPKHASESLAEVGCWPQS